MDRLTRDNNMDHLTKNHITINEQHGFFINKSCLTNLLETTDKVTESYNNGHKTLVVYQNFQKAFDKVCHESLLYKMERYGFNRKTINWTRSYLSNRSQRLVIGEDKFEWMPVTSWVQQVMVLGPLLFVILINDMPTVVNQIIKLFADDSKLIATTKNLDDYNKVREDLDALVKWAKDWLMLFHPIT